jgi:two-component system chemotaxis response regulator CheB
MNAVRVMIVEDSPTVLAALARVIRADPRLAVVAECQSAEEALTKLDRAAPDVISMDIHLPGMSGLEATRRIMERRPTPIVIVSRSVNADDLDGTMEALRAGAVSAVEKPACCVGADANAAMNRLCRELAVMSRVKVVRQRFNRPPTKNIASAPGATATAQSGHASAFRMPAQSRGHGTPAIVGIVASTGGPRALECVLGALGADFPLPIVLVQHITPSFQKGFVSWLAKVVPQRVQEATHGELPSHGCVYVAPAAKHLVLHGERLALDTRPPVCGQCPSGTLLLQSLAASYGPSAVGVVLTGMGDDGAEGLLAIRRAGGYTITEDGSTAVVDGMPQAARAIGASRASLPLETIGAALRNLAALAEEVRA